MEEAIRAMVPTYHQVGKRREGHVVGVFEGDNGEWRAALFVLRWDGGIDIDGFTLNGAPRVWASREEAADWLSFWLETSIRGWYSPRTIDAAYERHVARRSTDWRRVIDDALATPPIQVWETPEGETHRRHIHPNGWDVRIVTAQTGQCVNIYDPTCIALMVRVDIS